MTGPIQILWALALWGAGPAAASDPVEIEFERYRLPNGLEVILHEDHSAPLVAVDVWYHVGSGNEVPGKSGFAHLFEHMMFQGAKHIGEDAHFETLKRIGGTAVNGTTNSDRTNYFEVVPSHQIETALWLESDRMGYLLDLLTEASLGNQRDVVRNERRQNYDNRPFGRERFAIAAALYPEGHPYRYLTIGRHEDIEGASLADVRGFFVQWYVPSNATLCLAGDFDSTQAKKLVEKWFGTFPTAPRPKGKEASTKLSETVTLELEDPFIRHERIHWVWPAPRAYGPGSEELEALAWVLGAEGWGRLSRALVVEQPLAQRVAAYHDGSGFSGEFHVMVDLQPGADRAAAEKIMRERLADALDRPLDPAELQRVVSGTEAGFVWSLEELLGRAERLQSFNHYTGDPGFTQEYLRRIRALTPQSVQKAARQWLSGPRVEAVTRPSGGR